MNRFIILVFTSCVLSLGTLAAPRHAKFTAPSSILSTREAALNAPGAPILSALRLVTELPKELPQRVSSLAYDGEKLWATIYLGRGIFATFDPATDTWQISREIQQHAAIKAVAGSFESPGGICFAAGKLWIAGSYGDSFGVVDPQTWRAERVFKVKQQDHYASQSYASITFDGQHLWMAWHWFNYYIPPGDAQRLLKVDRETGKLVESYPLPPGSAADMTHGLTWDGQQLWHVKDKLLSAIDPSNGNVNAQYELPQLSRPSGLAWDGQALWISEFRGRIWRLPFTDNEKTLATITR
jgi:streptogramin lyase